MIDIIVTLILIAFCGVIGKIIEKRHMYVLRKREEKFGFFPATTLKKSYENEEILDSALVVAQATVSVDYYKKFMSIILSFLGLNIYVYETLLDRCRREALLRLKEKAMEIKANAVINVKFDTVMFNNNRTQSAHCVAVIASGTAIDIARK